MSEDRWSGTLNYFNYFTEVEEHFQRARGTGLFLMSPVDWALIETWKNAGIPMEAVLRGIDVAFEKWREKKQRGRAVNSLAYCTQAVVDEAERMAGGESAQVGKPEAAPPFAVEELRAHLERVRKETEALGRADLSEVVKELADLEARSAEVYGNLESLEQLLSALEDKVVATLRAGQSAADLAEARGSLDRHLRPYRGKMTAPQLAMLEKQYLDRWLFERSGAPRLSLFYLR